MSVAGDADEFGVLERHAGASVLRFRRRLSHPVDLVWRALTDEAELAAWFPTTIEGERLPGSPLRFSFPQGEAEPFAGELLAFDPPHVLELQWGDDVLRFDVHPDGPGCVLRLTVTFPEHGKAARDAAGWHVCLERLDHGLGGAVGAFPPDRWRAAHAVYVERLGPKASVIGPPAGLEEPEAPPES